MEEQLISMVLDNALSLFMKIYRMAANVKSNNERCQELTRRVKSLEKLVLKIKQRGQGPGQISPVLGDTLVDLCHNLQSTKEWMEKFTRKERFKKFFRGGSHEEKFKKLNEKLSENCQSLSLALLVDHGEMIDGIHDTLVQRQRQRAQIPGFSPPEPASAPQALIPSMPLPGPSNFSLDVNYAPYGQTSALNPFIPQPVPLNNIGFSNATYPFSPYLTFPGVNDIQQYSSAAFSNNGAVAFVSKQTFYVYQ